MGQKISAYTPGDANGGDFVFSKGGVTYKATGNTRLGPVVYGQNGDLPGTFVYAGLYGVKGDGTDVTTAFADAVAAAKAAGLPLQLPPGTVKLAPSSTIDLSGVPALLGDTVIDVSGATASPVFSVNGTRELLASGVGLSEGQTSLTVGTGLNIERGDTIVITSVEALPNPARTYYYKGSRVTAESYDSTNGTLVVYPGVDFSYSSAHVWVIKEKRLVIGPGVEIVGAEGGAQTGIEAKYARLELHGALRHFGATGARYVTSSGVVSGEITDTVYSGTGTSYGVSVGDLSDVHFVGARIIAARHAVAAGGGTWDAGDSGGTAGENAAYPAAYTVNGGHYGSNGTIAANFALDAHGVTRSVVISGAIIEGGVSIAARESVITGNIIIFSPSAVGGVYVSSDAASSTWGKLTLANNTIRGIGSTPGKAAIRIGGTLEAAFITGNVVDTDYGGDTGTYSVPLRIDGAVGNLVMRNNDIVTKNTPVRSYIAVSGSVEFAGNRMNGVYMNIATTANNTRIHITGNTATNSPAYGIFVRGDGYSGHDLVISNNVAYGNAAAGIYAYTFDRVVATGNRCFDNGSLTSLLNSARAGLYMVVVGTAHLVGNNCSSSGSNQLYGITVIGSTVTTSLMLIGNETTGNVNGDYYLSGVAVKARVANRGSATINDYILASNGSSYQFDGSSWTAV